MRIWALGGGGSSLRVAPPPNYLPSGDIFYRTVGLGCPCAAKEAQLSSMSASLQETGEGTGGGGEGGWQHRPRVNITMRHAPMPREWRLGVASCLLHVPCACYAMRRCGRR